MNIPVVICLVFAFCLAVIAAHSQWRAAPPPTYAPVAFLLSFAFFVLAQLIPLIIR